MNIDLTTLSVAVHNVAATERLNGARSTPDAVISRMDRRRRSSGKIDTMKFLEAANHSWNSGLEYLPKETPALQKRRSSRANNQNNKTNNDGLHTEIVHHHNNSWPACEYGDATPEKETKTMMSSKKILPTVREKKSRRRNSLSGDVRTPPVGGETYTSNNHDNHEGPAVRHKGGSLVRRSSLQALSNNKHPSSLLENNNDNSSSSSSSSRKNNNSSSGNQLPIRKISSDPSHEAPSGKRRVKMRRRSTIGTLEEEKGGGGEDITIPSRRSTLKKTPTTATTTTTTTRSNGKGSVTFALDHKNRIKRHVRVYRSQASRTHLSSLWWSEDDLERIYQRENGVYEEFSADRKYKKSVRLLWGSCSKAATVPLSSKDIAHVAGSTCRGLEVDILETVRDRRARVIKSVINAQEALLDFDPILRGKALGARYKNLCRSAVRFAKRMAEGDELQAANIYSSKGSSSSN